MFALGTVLFVPGALFGLAGGVLFGPIWGIVLNIASATLGASAAFLVARYVAADWVREKAGTRLDRLIKGVEVEGWRFVVLMRLVPNILSTCSTTPSASRASLSSPTCWLPLSAWSRARWPTPAAGLQRPAPCACARQEGLGCEITVFLMADAVLAAKGGRRTPEGFYDIEHMLKRVLAAKGCVLLCGTCMDARGFTDSELMEGTRRRTMDELAAATIEGDKVLLF